MSCCVEQTDGAPGGGSGGSSQSIVTDGLVLAEFYFDEAANGPISDGPVTVPSSVGDFTFTAVNSANAAAWEFNNGLHFVQPVSAAGVINSTTQTGPYIGVPVSAIPGFGFGWPIVLKMWVSQYTEGPASVSDQVRSGFFKDANDPAASLVAAGAAYGFRRSATIGNNKCIFNAFSAANGTALNTDLVGVADVAMISLAHDAQATTGIGNYIGGEFVDLGQTQVQANSFVWSSSAMIHYFGAAFASNPAPTLEFTIRRAQFIRG